MRISTKGRYALRMMVDIAQHQDEGNVSLKDISVRQEISKKYLEQIVPMLTKAGCLQTQRGFQGGYKLAKKPEEYKLSEILKLTEISLNCVSCLENDLNTCSRKDSCPTLPIWKELDQLILNYLDSKTLQDLIDNTELHRK